MQSSNNFLTEKTSQPAKHKTCSGKHLTDGSNLKLLAVVMRLAKKKGNI